MTQRNRPSPDIHLRAIDAQIIDAVDGHGGEGFVDLDDVDICAQVEGEFGEEFGDREGGADAHYPRGDAGDGGADVFGEDGLGEAEGG